MLVEMRNEKLEYRGRLQVISGQMVLRNTGVGTWQIDADWASMAERLQPGWGVRICDDEGLIMSGPVDKFEIKATGKTRTLTASGVSDMHLLQDMVTIPDPGDKDKPPVFDQMTDSWKKSGKAETVILELISTMIGPKASPVYRVPDLEVPASEGRGENITLATRFKNLLEEIQAQAQAGKVILDIRQDGLHRFVDVTVPRDRTRQVRLTRQSGAVGDYTLSQEALTANDIIVGGTGESAARPLFRKANPLDEWNRHITKFEDKGSSGKSEEMQQAAKTALEEGVAKSLVTFDLEDTAGRRFGRDFGIGDKITIDLDGAQVQDTVQTAEISWDQAGRKIKLQVGPVPDESKLNQASGELVKTVKQLRRQLAEQATR